MRLIDECCDFFKVITTKNVLLVTVCHLFLTFLILNSTVICLDLWACHSWLIKSIYFYLCLQQPLWNCNCSNTSPTPQSNFYFPLKNCNGADFPNVDSDFTKFLQIIKPWKVRNIENLNLLKPMAPYPPHLHFHTNSSNGGGGGGNLFSVSWLQTFHLQTSKNLKRY